MINNAITGKNYIGKQLKASGNRVFNTFNPVLNLPTETSFTAASSEEVDEAVALAKIAFKEYRQCSPKKRAGFLNTIAEEIEALGDDLLEVFSEESGLPLGRAQGERGRTIAQLKAFAALLLDGNWVNASIDTAQPEQKPLPKPDIRKLMVPIGPVAVFGASNFPLAFSTAGGDTASALAAGCPVVVKAHPMHAGTSELVATAVIRAAEKTGMPNGVFSHLHSSGTKVGQLLVNHPDIQGVGFTGSIKGGRALYDLAAARDKPIPVFAEMGSINPVLLFPKAIQNKAEAWAKAYAGSITLASGQFCTNPGLLIALEGAVLDDFQKQLADALNDIAPACMLHPRIQETYENNRNTAVSQQEVTLLMEAAGETGVNTGKPTLLAVSGATFLKNSTLHQEVFGPFSLLVRCKNPKEMLRVVNQLEGQLTGTVIGEESEMREHENIVEALQQKVGRLIFNGVPTGVEVCPSMQHGGPYPASTDSRFTSVGTDAINRWVRPLSFQDAPQSMLPDPLKDENPMGIFRKVNGKTHKDPIFSLV